HLLDTYKAGVPGGTGESFDWSFLRERRDGAVPLVLSGGLNPENVTGAIESVVPWGVDVSSGVEAEPGVKDPARMRAFVAAVRSAAVAEIEDAPSTGAEDEVLTLAYARREAAQKQADAQHDGTAGA
ncbi:MAG: phosphoribosylanthranilate isomerase, partial [Thermoleophilia bacterium]|nr:phosphoribosylanthranilate isomerase [Thermoleophilia bacterium]